MNLNAMQHCCCHLSISCRNIVHATQEEMSIAYLLQAWYLAYGPGTKTSKTPLLEMQSHTVETEWLQQYWDFLTKIIILLLKLLCHFALLEIGFCCPTQAKIPLILSPHRNCIWKFSASSIWQLGLGRNISICLQSSGATGCLVKNIWANGAHLNSPWELNYFLNKDCGISYQLFCWVNWIPMELFSFPFVKPMAFRKVCDGAGDFYCDNTPKCPDTAESSTNIHHMLPTELLMAEAWGLCPEHFTMLGFSGWFIAEFCCWILFLKRFCFQMLICTIEHQL